MANENNVKLSGTVLWSENKEVVTDEGATLHVHRYLIQNVIKNKNDKQIKSSFTIEYWQSATPEQLFPKGDSVEVIGTLAINYRKAKDNNGQVITEKGSDGKDYPKTYKDVIIRATSVKSDMPF